MTVGVVGYGHVGTKVVRLLKAFGCRILVCDPYVQLSADDLRDGVEQVPRGALLARIRCRQSSRPRHRRDSAAFSAQSNSRP